MQVVDHGQHEIFYLFWLDTGFGEELCWAEAQLLHLGRRDLASRVDDERKSSKVRLTAQPVYQGKATSVGKIQIQYEKFRGVCFTRANGLVQRRGVIDAKPALSDIVLKAG